MIITLILWLFVYMNTIILTTILLYDGYSRTNIYELYSFFKSNDMKILQHSTVIYVIGMLILFNKDLILGEL